MQVASQFPNTQQLKAIQHAHRTPPLSVGWGYGIVLGLGAVFAVGMVGSTTPEAFYVPSLTGLDPRNRDSVKSGLVTSAVVSSWTWAAILIRSSGIAYRYGVSGPFWYANNTMVQILLLQLLPLS